MSWENKTSKNSELRAQAEKALNDSKSEIEKAVENLQNVVCKKYPDAHFTVSANPDLELSGFAFAVDKVNAEQIAKSLERI